MDTNSFTDFPDGGLLTSGPISPVGKCPFSISELERVVRTGTRAAHFSRKIARLFKQLPADSSKLGPIQINRILKVASASRSLKDVRELLGLNKKRRGESRLSPEQKIVVSALKSGTRARNYSKQIESFCANLPDEIISFSVEEVKGLIDLAQKCRSTTVVRSVIDYKNKKRSPEKSISEPKRARKKLSQAEREEKRRHERRTYKKLRMANDPSFRVVSRLRERLRRIVKGRAISQKMLVLLGCSRIELRRHLEKQWADGMSWENYGIDGWHVDHIRPCASFDLTRSEDQAICFHYTNLQPLWAKDNISKGSKWEPKRSSEKENHLEFCLDQQNG